MNIKDNILDISNKLKSNEIDEFDAINLFIDMLSLYDGDILEFFKENNLKIVIEGLGPFTKFCLYHIDKENPDIKTPLKSGSLIDCFHTGIKTIKKG